MKLPPSAYRLYAITADASPESLLTQVQDAIAGGITMLQIRKKHCSTDSLIEFARTIVAYCQESGIPCIINDNVEAALCLQANGVHLGQQDMSLIEARKRLGTQAIIGTSAHNVEEAILAERQGADYIGCGAVFPTGTKSDATPLSFETLCHIRKAVSIPMVAIGGITLRNAVSLKSSNIDGIAVVSALFGQPNILFAAQKLRKLSDSICSREASI